MDRVPSSSLQFYCRLLLTVSSFGVVALAGCAAGGATGGSTGAGTSAISVTMIGAAQTRMGATTQFSATVVSSSNQGVTWAVNGVPGGSSAGGTISTTGLYSAPAMLPVPNTVSVTATSVASGSASATIAEAIWNPVPGLTTAAATQVGNVGSFLLDVRGTSFVSGATLRVGGTGVPTTYVSASELQATINPANGTTAVMVDVLNPDPGAAASTSASVQLTVVKVPLAAAARLLDQVTFGPTLADITHVQAVGLNGYLTEQFNAAPTVLPDLPNPLPSACAPNNPIPCEQSEWWQAAITGNDQLRQRVAFALAEMFVISTNSVSPNAVIPYQNMLVRDAFGNFSTVLKDVTLSTGMGNYLNMLNSNKPGNGQIANENYARELMQLFTTGLVRLNADGTVRLDAQGNPIPTYTQQQVQAFARAYTGWTYATSTGGAPTHYPNTSPNYSLPMMALDSAHDETAKTLLEGTTLPAGQTAAQDLDGALSNLFNHPNVGPFIGRQLIQHLVMSNPSPAYVGRVSAVFADDGHGVRGNLHAVIQAILLDQDARAGDTNPGYDGGRLREPILYVTNMVRGLGFVNTDANGYYGTLSNYSGALGEKPYGSNSVFNFFPPSYMIPGTVVNAPEFDLENTATVILRLTLADNVVYNRLSGFRADLSATSAFGQMAANPGNLADSLGIVFMHGQMPAAMRTAIVNHISTFSDPAERVRVATYLVITAPQYKVLH